MKPHLRGVVTGLVLCFPLFSYSQVPELTESVLAGAYAEESLSRRNLEIGDMRRREATENVRSDYAPSLNASLQTLNSTKDPSSASQPVLQSSSGWDIHVAKAWSFGLASKAGVSSGYSELAFTPSNIISHEPSLYAELSASLLQNLAGRVDRARLRGSETLAALDSLRDRIEYRQGFTRVRMAYWNLVANEMSHQSTKSLLLSARRQLSEIESRRKSGIAENADVLLSRAQVAQRESAVFSLKIKEQALQKELLQEMPSLARMIPFRYPAPNVDTLISELSRCLEIIRKHPKAPIAESSFAAVLPLLAENEEARAAAAGFGKGPEISAVLRGETNGVDASFSEAFSESTGFDKRTWSAGLRLRLPLDSSESRTAAAREKIARLELQREATRLARNLEATHANALGSIDMLLGSMSTLTSSTVDLEQRVQLIEKKFKQGRVDLLSLVQEQDQLFTAQNALTHSRLLFIEQLLGYFLVFDRTPCTFNRIHDEAVTGT